MRLDTEGTLAIGQAMSLDAALRDVVRAILEELRPVVLEDLRRLLREEHGTHVPPANSGTGVQEIFVSAARAAEVAGVQPAAVRSWIAHGKLPSHRAGRLIRVRLDDLRAFLSRSSDRRDDAEVINLDRRAQNILRGRQFGGS